MANDTGPATPESMGAVNVDINGECSDPSHDEDIAPDYSGVVAMNDFVVIWPVRPPKTKGAIVIPEGAKTTEIGRDEGTILMVGPKCKLGFEVGDHVYYYRHAGSWQVAPEVDNKLIRLMKEVEIYARRKREGEE